MEYSVHVLHIFFLGGGCQKQNSLPLGPILPDTSFSSAVALSKIVSKEKNIFTLFPILTRRTHSLHRQRLTSRKDLKIVFFLFFFFSVSLSHFLGIYFLHLSLSMHAFMEVFCVKSHSYNSGIPQKLDFFDNGIKRYSRLTNLSWST